MKNDPYAYIEFPGDLRTLDNVEKCIIPRIREFRALFTKEARRFGRRPERPEVRTIVAEYRLTERRMRARLRELRAKLP